MCEGTELAQAVGGPRGLACYGAERRFAQGAPLLVNAVLLKYAAVLSLLVASCGKAANFIMHMQAIDVMPLSEVVSEHLTQELVALLSNAIWQLTTRKL